MIAGEKGGSLARRVFLGLGIATAYRFLMSILGLWKETPTFTAGAQSSYPKASVNCDVTPSTSAWATSSAPRSPAS